jgi:biotin transport system substrate-specific component
MKTKKVIDSISRIAIFLALLIVGSFMTLQTGLIKFTLQLLVIFIIGLTLSLKEGLIIVVLYIVMGLIGIPVFSGFGGGFAYVFAPTFGFVYGFIPGLIAMWAVKKLDNKIQTNYVVDALACVACLLVVYAFGFLHGYLILNTMKGLDYSFAYLLSIFIVPYIPFDLLKICVAIVCKSCVYSYYGKRIFRVR